MYVYMCTMGRSGAHRGQKKELDAQKLELWADVSYLMWVLELNPGLLQDWQLLLPAQPFLQ